MRDSLAPYFTGDTIKRYAAEYLREAHPSGDIPIPIDEIVEGYHEIEIVPYPNLDAHRGVEGFVTPDCKTIYIDEEVVKRRNPVRYRFTLAHELAHVILHQRVFKKATFLTVDGWIAFLETISDQDERYIESQAYKMAGYLLVPTPQFELVYEEHTRILLEAGQDIRGLSPRGLRIIASKIAERFQVSWKCIMWQGVHEGLWKADEFPTA